MGEVERFIARVRRGARRKRCAWRGEERKGAIVCAIANKKIIADCEMGRNSIIIIASVRRGK